MACAVRRREGSSSKFMEEKSRKTKKFEDKQ
jgi:hypothetical protein